MYSPQLEELMRMAVADGVLTDKERMVLYKRAQAEGVDLDEFEIILEGRLAEAQRATMSTMAPPPPMPPTPSPAAPAAAPTTKYGDVKKCPSCGQPIEPGTIRCESCGYAFRGVESVSSVEKFSKMMRDIEEKHANKRGGIISELLGEISFGNSGRDKELYTAITTFPIPNSKEDLIEFILYLQPKANDKKFEMGKTMSEVKLGKAYCQKYQECLTKANYFLQDDPQFQTLLERNGIVIKKRKKFGLF